MEKIITKRIQKKLNFQDWRGKHVTAMLALTKELKNLGVDFNNPQPLSITLKEDEGEKWVEVRIAK